MRALVVIAAAALAGCGAGTSEPPPTAEPMHVRQRGLLLSVVIDGEGRVQAPAFECVGPAEECPPLEVLDASRPSLRIEALPATGMQFAAWEFIPDYPATVTLELEHEGRRGSCAFESPSLPPPSPDKDYVEPVLELPFGATPERTEPRPACTGDVTVASFAVPIAWRVVAVFVPTE